MTKRPLYLIWTLIAVSLLLVGIYVYFYQFSNFESETNDLILNLVSLGAPLSSAIFATMTFRFFGVEDKPRKIWKVLMIFIWLWTIAEFIWTGYLLLVGDVPLPSLADTFWLSGFVFLTIALRQQYQLVTRTQVPWWQIGALWLGVFSMTLVIVLATGKTLTLGNYLEFFYAVADFACGLAAVRIFVAFRGGLMSRPWVGLLVLGLADAIYAWLIASNMYAMSQAEGNILSLFADTLYMTAYLILGIGFFATYLVLKYGPESFTIRKA